MTNALTITHGDHVRALRLVLATVEDNQPAIIAIAKEPANDVEFARMLFAMADSYGKYITKKANYDAADWLTATITAHEAKAAEAKAVEAEEAAGEKQ